MMKTDGPYNFADDEQYVADCKAHIVRPAQLEMITAYYKVRDAIISSCNEVDENGDMLLRPPSPHIGSKSLDCFRIGIRINNRNRPDESLIDDNVSLIFGNLYCDPTKDYKMTIDIAIYKIAIRDTHAYDERGFEVGTIIDSQEHHQYPRTYILEDDWHKFKNGDWEGGAKFYADAAKREFLRFDEARKFVLNDYSDIWLEINKEEQLLLQRRKKALESLKNKLEIVLDTSRV